MAGILKDHQRRAILMLVFILTIVLAAIAQDEEELQLVGNYDDVSRIKANYTHDTNQFVFTRLVYNGRIPGYYKNWYTDYPRADRNLIDALKRLTNIDIADRERVVAINDPDLFRYPMVYSSEVEQMVLTTEDAAIMREYLTRGGFWIVDDFWGSFEWSLFSDQIRKVFPDRKIEDIPLNDPIFHEFFDVDRLTQTPSLAYAFNGGFTWETDGFAAECKGIRDDKGRLVMIINHNTDLGDAYEWSDDPRYPEKYSAYAFHMAVNFVLYAMTH